MDFFEFPAMQSIDIPDRVATIRTCPLGEVTTILERFHRAVLAADTVDAIDAITRKTTDEIELLMRAANSSLLTTENRDHDNEILRQVMLDIVLQQVTRIVRSLFQNIVERDN